MKKLVLSFSLLVCLVQISMAEDYLLDASTMSVGETAGENLIVKEGCLDPEQTTCTEKVKWLSAPITKIGNLEVMGIFTGDFEINVIINVNDGSKGIVLFTEDNKGIEYSITWNGHSGGYMSNVSFLPKGIGINGGTNFMIEGWNKYTAFNNITLTVQQGVAKVHVNGSEAVETPITLDPDTVFNRLLIKGVSSDDRLSEVRVRGIQSCNTGSGCEGIYTQEQVDQMVRKILTWGDTNNDNKIGLEEAVNALQVTSGIK